MAKGYINSFQSLGTVDGPGIRMVVFMQGCNLRCSCCHNPETWQMNVGESYEPSVVVEKALRLKEYFGERGGVTVSGGEPLLQACFVKELFDLCHENGINTCLDTSGSMLNNDVLNLLDCTDRVLLDVKYTNNEQYQQHVGCSLDRVLEFLNVLEAKKIKTTIRQVIIPTLNDDEKNVKELKSLVEKHSVVDGVELLAFKNICKVKYDALKLNFKLSHLSETSLSKIEELNRVLFEKYM